MTNVLEYLEDTAGRWGDKIACRDENEAYTFSELMHTSKVIGTSLAKAIKPQTSVVVFMEKSPKTMAVLFGIVYAGGFYVNVDVKEPVSRLEAMFSTLENTVIVTEEMYFNKLEQFNEKYTIMQAEELINADICEETLGKIRNEADEDDILYGIFTSGSTGVPKNVVVSHKAVITFIDCFVEEMGITEADVLGNQAAFDFDVAVKDIYSCIKTGASLCIIPRKMFSNPPRLMGYLDECKVTTLVWVVSALGIISTLDALSCLKPIGITKIIFSGEVMPPNVFNYWRNFYNKAHFVNVYGPTEITCNCAYYVAREQEITKPLPIGKAFKCHEIFLLSEDGSIIKEKDTVGEICVAGETLAKEYYHMPEETKKAFGMLEGKRVYYTGDLARYDEAGNLYYISRKDYQIKHNGYRIELGDIEAVMLGILGVNKAYCIYQNVEKQIHAFFEGDANVQDVKKQLKERLPKYMQPAKVLREEIPLTRTGKIDRKRENKSE